MLSPQRSYATEVAANALEQLPPFNAPGLPPDRAFQIRSSE